MGSTASRNEENSFQNANSDTSKRASLSESCEILRSIDPYRFYISNGFIDVLDKDNEWRVAKIHEINEENSTITLDGWNQNEV